MIYFNSIIFKIRYQKLLNKIFKTAIEELNYNYNDFEVELNFVDENKIKQLNNDFRKIDKITDVLSFPYFNREDFINFEENKNLSFNYDTNKVMLGEIDICFEKAKEQAKQYGHTLKREVGFLFLHAILHLFGFDHIIEEDKKQMRQKEEEILKKVNLGR